MTWLECLTGAGRAWLATWDIFVGLTLCPLVEECWGSVTTGWLWLPDPEGADGAEPVGLGLGEVGAPEVGAVPPEADPLPLDVPVSETEV